MIARAAPRIGLRYASVCAGIEAASVAWHPLGWTPAWFSEIAPFPCAVLAHHYPTVPNLGDMTRIDDARLAEHGPVDLLIGGTPCQSFSVAGLRKGLADPRGNLALVFLGLLDRMRPRWVVWENVPGVLSVDAGRAFGAFLGGLGQLGYGWSYRVLDAQYFGVAQRRSRVFVVGHAGGWARAAAVLLESSSLRGDPAPSREAGAGVAGALDGGAHGGGFDGNDARAGKCVAVEEDNQNGTRLSETAGSIRANAPGTKPGGTLALVAHAIQDARDLEKKQNGLGVQRELAYTLDRAATQAVAFRAAFSNQGMETGYAPTLDTNPMAVGPVAFHATQDPISGDVCPAIAAKSLCGTNAASGVRRLTPREAERLQGFPDDYTLVPYRGKPAADGPRYMALGNSMAVPVVRWIGERIARVEEIP